MKLDNEITNFYKRNIPGVQNIRIVSRLQTHSSNIVVEPMGIIYARNVSQHNFLQRRKKGTSTVYDFGLYSFSIFILL